MLARTGAALEGIKAKPPVFAWPTALLFLIDQGGGKWRADIYSIFIRSFASPPRIYMWRKLPLSMTSEWSGSDGHIHFTEADNDESRVPWQATTEQRVDRFGTRIALLVLVIALFGAAVWLVQYA